MALAWTVGGSETDELADSIPSGGDVGRRFGAPNDEGMECDFACTFHYMPDLLRGFQCRVSSLVKRGNILDVTSVVPLRLLDSIGELVKGSGGTAGSRAEELLKLRMENSRRGK